MADGTSTSRTIVASMKIAALQAVVPTDGIHHAGNSSQITDGASAVLL
jgi:acetyl-CoA acetyltransferase